MIRDLAEEAGVILPNTVHYGLFTGQVTQKELTAAAYDMPKTEAQRDTFDYVAFEAAVKSKRGVLPKTFHMADVRAHTKTLLVPPDMVRETGNRTGKTGDDKRDRYCKTCECRHPHGKHTKEGKERFKKKKEGDSKKNDRKDENKTRSQRALRAQNTSDGDNQRAPRKSKCYQCGKVHYPFCKKEPGQRGKCFVCNKVHFPYCKRTDGADRRKTASSNETNVIEALEKLRAVVSAAKESDSEGDLSPAIQKRLDELFCMETATAEETTADQLNGLHFVGSSPTALAIVLDAEATKSTRACDSVIHKHIDELFMMHTKSGTTPYGKSKICRAVAKVFSPTGDTVTAVNGPNSLSPVTMARKTLLHGLHERISPAISGFKGGGSLSLNLAGYLVIPHESKPGSILVDALAAKESELPRGMDVLLSKQVTGDLNIDLLAHCKLGTQKTDPKIIFANTPVASPATHTVTANDGKQFNC